MSSAFIRSTIDVRHSSFSLCAATALSRIGATSTDCAGAADDAVDDAVLVPPPAAAPAEAVPPLGGVAPAACPKIALMIFPKMLIICSQWMRDCVKGLERSLFMVTPRQNLAA